MSIRHLSFIALATALFALPAPLHAQTTTILHEFTGPNGGNPQGLTAIGNSFYGTTFQGGSAGFGTVFKFDPATLATTTLHTFGGGADGAISFDVPILLGGLLYGVAESGGSTACQDGCGVVYSIDPTTLAYKIVYKFTGSPDGAHPRDTLIAIGDALYGTTSSGGSGACGNGCGTVFRLDPASGSEVVLHSVASGSDGSGLFGLTLFNGLLYGTTLIGGPSNGGTIFSIDPTTGTYSLLHTFAAGPDGETPLSPLLLSGNTLYATTNAGGRGCPKSGGCGTVFSFNPATGAEAPVHQFCCRLSLGAKPGELTAFGPALYGTTEYAGGGLGSVFKLFPNSGRFTTLASFSADSRGANPSGRLVIRNGTIYGTTMNGGPNNLGIIYKITP